MASDLIDKFLREARNVVLGASDRLEFGTAELDALLDNDLLVARFKQRFRTEVQDPDLRELITQYLRGIASKEDELAEDCKIDADGIDKYVGRPGIAVAIGGAAALLATGVGAIALLGGGAIAMVVAGARSTGLRKRANRHSSRAKRLRTLTEGI